MHAQELTGLENPASPLQLQEWLNQHGCPIESMAKESVDDALESASGDVKEALELRQELSRSSVQNTAR